MGRCFRAGRPEVGGLSLATRGFERAANYLAIGSDPSKICSARFMADEIGIGCLAPFRIRVEFAQRWVKERPFSWRNRAPIYKLSMQRGKQRQESSARVPC